MYVRDTFAQTPSIPLNNFCIEPKVKFSPATTTFSIITLRFVCKKCHLKFSFFLLSIRLIMPWGTVSADGLLSVLKSEQQQQEQKQCDYWNLQNLCTLSLIRSQQQLSVCSHSIATLTLSWQWINGRKWKRLPVFKMFVTKTAVSRQTNEIKKT